MQTFQKKIKSLLFSSFRIYPALQSTYIPLYYFNDTPKRERIEIIIDPKDLEWKQTRGGGPGGQATNKTNNCVLLTHKPTGIMIKCHDSRDTETNKNYAIKRLKQKLDEQINGELSKKNLEIKKAQKLKDVKRRRVEKKYKEKKESGSQEEPEKNSGEKISE